MCSISLPERVSFNFPAINIDAGDDEARRICRIILADFPEAALACDENTQELLMSGSAHQRLQMAIRVRGAARASLTATYRRKLKGAQKEAQRNVEELGIRLSPFHANALLVPVDNTMNGPREMILRSAIQAVIDILKRIEKDQPVTKAAPARSNPRHAAARARRREHGAIGRKTAASAARSRSKKKSAARA